MNAITTAKTDKIDRVSKTAVTNAQPLAPDRIGITKLAGMVCKTNDSPTGLWMDTVRKVEIGGIQKITGIEIVPVEDMDRIPKGAQLLVRQKDGVTSEELIESGNAQRGTGIHEHSDGARTYGWPKDGVTSRLAFYIRISEEEARELLSMNEVLEIVEGRPKAEERLEEMVRPKEIPKEEYMRQLRRPMTLNEAEMDHMVYKMECGGV